MAKPNFDNRTLFVGDNLDFLCAMNTESVRLIATDPPYNKGKDFHATPGSLAAGGSFKDRWSWERDVHDNWVSQIEDDYPNVWRVIDFAKHAHSDGMGAFLCFLAVRLIEMKRVLANDGSIFLHCDPSASHYIKAMMDAIFGWKNFRNDIIWGYRRMPSKAKKFQSMHDNILFYTKSDAAVFNVLNVAPTDASLSTYERAMKVGYNANLSKKMVTVFDEKKYQAAVDSGRLPKDLSPVPFSGGESPMPDHWSDIKVLGSMNGERTGYPTQKPIALYERIISAASKPGDWVLDPFAGCCTTPVAAERLGRKWIAMDLWEPSYGLLAYRFRNERVKMENEEANLRKFLADMKARPGKTKGEQRLEAEVRAILAAPPLPNGSVGVIHMTKELPTRTSRVEKGAPVFYVPDKRREDKVSQGRIKLHLLKRDGQICQGCDWPAHSPRYLEVDHMKPKSKGGEDALPNRILLCSPCNGRKGNRLTIAQLRRKNKELNSMYGQADILTAPQA